MGVDSRLKRLEEVMSEYQRSQNFTVFILEDGSSYATRLDALDYLIQNGTNTPRGKIAVYPHPVEGVDALSLALFATVNEEIRTGALRQATRELRGDD